MQWQEECFAWHSHFAVVLDGGDVLVESIELREDGDVVVEGGQESLFEVVVVSD